MPTIKDVAKLAKVGVGTVSRVINNDGHVSKDAKESVLKAIKKLNYTPNVMGKRLRTNKSSVIALMVPVIVHPFFNELASFVEQEADKYGYSMLLVSSQQRISKEDEIINKISCNEVDGAIFVTHYEHKWDKLSDLAIVSIDRHLDNNIPFVTSNNYEASKDAIKYLINKGCKKIAYLGSKPLVESEVLERLRAYKDVIKEYGLNEYILNERINHGEETTLVDEFLNKYQDIEAVFVSGYSLADVLYGRLLEKNIDVPNTLQIICYDGDFSNSVVSNSLTCIQQPIKEMAIKACELLMKRINKNNDYEIKNVLKSRLVLGKTTK